MVRPMNDEDEGGTEDGTIHISTDPMHTDDGNINYALPLCGKGPRRAVGSAGCHYAGDVHSTEEVTTAEANHSVVNLIDGRGWWKDSTDNWCEECYAIAKQEGERIMAMISLGGDNI